MHSCFHHVTKLLCLETDEPPHSKAGKDIILQLPIDWVILDGRESIDDHGIIQYEWALLQGAPSFDMKVYKAVQSKLIICRI